MVIKNKIWEEMKQAHANVLCVKWYTDKQRKHDRYYQMFIALVASGGTFGYLLNDIAPLISSSIIAFVSVVKALFPHFIQPEKELCILDGLMDYYNGYMTELEHLYFRYETEDISDKETEEFLYHLKKEEGGKQSTFNRLVRSIPQKRHEKIIQESETYINRVYYNIMSKKSNTTIPHGTGETSTHSTYTIHQGPEIHGEMPRFSNVPPPPSPKKK